MIPAPDLPAADYSWMLQAECRGCNPEIFFPARGENRALRRAKEICSNCSVQQQCLDYALTLQLKHGIYGGQSERQRRTLRRTNLRTSRLQEMLPSPSSVYDPPLER